MENIIVMKEETVPSSVSTDIEQYVPTSFIVEDYSEEVCESPSRMEVTPPNELNIAQEVFIENDQVTYEVRTIEEVIGFNVPASVGKHTDTDDVFDEDGASTSLVFYQEGDISSSPSTSSSRKASLKKRRGRPPKFQVSEIGIDGRKWYSCTVCDEKHEDRMELMQHMRQHNAERPFHCRECGKAFKQAAHLKVHVRQHTGEKPFECTICGKGFRQKAIVDQHMRTHTQLRPYVCTYVNCDKSFAQKTSLDNHLKSHQTGRLSEAFKKQQEEQKRKSLLAQEAIKNKSLKPNNVLILPGVKKSSGNNESAGAVSGSNTGTGMGQGKVRTTVVKMTQSQFEQYLQSKSVANTGSSQPNSLKQPTNGSQKEMTTKQKAATGPFLAYVNLCKPLLQAERPELSLLEVLKELASRWNNMSKTEKQKFAIIAKESDESKNVPISSILNSTKIDQSRAEAQQEDEDCEVDATDSMEGAVFEIGEASSGEFRQQVDKPLSDERYFQVNEIRDKSLNQNVFGKRVVLLSKDGQTRKYSNEEKLQVVTNFDSDPMPMTPEVDQSRAQEAFESGEVEASVLHFEDTPDKNTVIFDAGSDNTVVYENGYELETGNTIFYLPNIVGGEQLEEVL